MSDVSEGAFFALNELSLSTVFSIITKRIPSSVKPLAAELKSAGEQWAAGKMCKFDYLMTLNKLSGRSLNDLMQYPVMPWVVQDYSSDTLDLADPAVY